jgi:hypothetical protein
VKSQQEFEQKLKENSFFSQHFWMKKENCTLYTTTLSSFFANLAERMDKLVNDVFFLSLHLNPELDVIL